jgi:hypothetical protein
MKDDKESTWNLDTPVIVHSFWSEELSDTVMNVLPLK